MRLKPTLSDHDHIHLKTLSRLLVNYRKQNGWSVADFCKMAHIDRDSYTKVERGERNPTIGVLESILSVYGISMHSFFSSDYQQFYYEEITEGKIDQMLNDNLCRMIDRQKIIRMIKKFRKSRKISQSLLAMEMGIQRNYINNFEYGRSKVTPELLKGILTVMEIDIETFLDMLEVPEYLRKF